MLESVEGNINTCITHGVHRSSTSATHRESTPYTLMHAVVTHSSYEVYQNRTMETILDAVKTIATPIKNAPMIRGRQVVRRGDAEKASPSRLPGKLNKYSSLQEVCSAAQDRTMRTTSCSPAFNLRSKLSFRPVRSLKKLLTPTRNCSKPSLKDDDDVDDEHADSKLIPGCSRKQTLGRTSCKKLEKDCKPFDETSVWVDTITYDQHTNMTAELSSSWYSQTSRGKKTHRVSSGKNALKDISRISKVSEYTIREQASVCPNQSLFNQPLSSTLKYPLNSTLICSKSAAALEPAPTASCQEGKFKLQIPTMEELIREAAVNREYEDNSSDSEKAVDQVDACTKENNGSDGEKLLTALEDVEDTLCSFTDMLAGSGTETFQCGMQQFVQACSRSDETVTICEETGINSADASTKTEVKKTITRKISDYLDLQVSQDDQPVNDTYSQNMVQLKMVETEFNIRAEACNTSGVSSSSTAVKVDQHTQTCWSSLASHGGQEVSPRATRCHKESRGSRRRSATCSKVDLSKEHKSKSMADGLCFFEYAQKSSLTSEPSQKRSNKYKADFVKSSDVHRSKSRSRLTLHRRNSDELKKEAKAVTLNSKISLSHPVLNMSDVRKKELVRKMKQFHLKMEHTETLAHL